MCHRLRDYNLSLGFEPKIPKCTVQTYPPSYGGRPANKFSKNNSIFRRQRIFARAVIPAGKERTTQDFKVKM